VICAPHSHEVARCSIFPSRSLRHGPGCTYDRPSGPRQTPGMWQPILHHEDGYGLTYGARYSFDDALGDRGRMSVPLTWGGERRVALKPSVCSTVRSLSCRGAVSLHRRVNPHFDLPDTRREARVEAERVIRDWLRIGPMRAQRACSLRRHPKVAYDEHIEPRATSRRLRCRQANPHAAAPAPSRPFGWRTASGDRRGRGLPPYGCETAEESRYSFAESPLA
jgi:hypothetical protein